MSSARSEGPDLSIVGATVEAKVIAVFHWGVILDLGLSKMGLIDALYIDDGDEYAVGEAAMVVLDDFDEQKDKFIARPPTQIPLVDRLRAKGHDV
jgi:hypothetical protein